jgi:hypothetical protein
MMLEELAGGVDIVALVGKLERSRRGTGAMLRE